VAVEERADSLHRRIASASADERLGLVEHQHDGLVQLHAAQFGELCGQLSGRLVG
jgi:hypothetical protein